MACAIPTAPSGGTLVTTDSPTYADGTRAVFICNSNYVMSGDPYATCNTGTWSTFPTCTAQVSNTVTVDINESDDDTDKALVYVAIAACCVLALLFITCMIVCCCQLFGGYGEGLLFGHPRRCWCCDGRRSHKSRYCTAFPRRYELDEHGRRFHLDDNGHRCYYNHKVKKVVSQAVSPDSAVHSETPTRTFTTTVNEIIAEKKAKELAAWKPHSHPIRNINTSTK